MSTKQQSDDQTTWGVHINRRSGTPYPVCPQWVTRVDQTEWMKLGVVVWNETTKKVLCLLPQKALDVLDDLRELSVDESKPFHLHWNSYTVPFSEEDRQSWRTTKNCRSMGTEGEIRPNDFLLAPDQAHELFLFLEEHEQDIRQLAEAHIQEVRRLLGKVYSVIMGWEEGQAKDQDCLE